MAPVVAEVMFFTPKPGTDTTALFAPSAPILKAQPGFKAVYFGPLVEDDKVVCVLVEWTDRASVDALQLKKDVVAELQAGMLDAVDPDGVAPFRCRTQFMHGIAEAVAAPVTEIGFLSLPAADATEEFVREKVIAAMPADPATHPVVKVANATPPAMGFVYETIPEKADEGSKIALSGLVGFQSVEDHWAWLKTEECKKIVEDMGKVGVEVGLKPVEVLGKGTTMFEGGGMFHARFTKVI